MVTFWDLVESVGPIEEYEDGRATVGKALSSRRAEKRAAEITWRIRHAEEKAIAELEKALVCLRGDRNHG
jgi:hypothetical protein